MMVMTMITLKEQKIMCMFKRETYVNNKYISCNNIHPEKLFILAEESMAIYFLFFSNSMRRTFDTVRMTGKYPGSGSQGSLSSLGYGGSMHSTPTHHPHTSSHLATPTHMVSSGVTYGVSYMSSRGSSVYSGGSGHPSLDSGADSDASMHTDSEDNYP